MRFFRLVAFLVFSLCAYCAHAEVFVVTSNADSGAGTLREALTLADANGSGVQDFIYFNLPDLSEAGRTISVLSDLPSVPANLVINGETQPGGAFGVSSAHLVITVADGLQIAALLSLQTVSNVEIYGIAFRGNRYPAQPFLPANCISVQNSVNITIGAAGKGNLFGNSLYGVAASGSTGVYLYGNMSGLKFDGLTTDIDYAAANFDRCTNIVIGSTVPGEGNIFTDYGQSEVIMKDSKQSLINGNFFGTNYTGNAVVGASFVGTAYTAYGVVTERCDNQIITNNVFAGLGLAVAIFVTNDTYTIAHNRMGVGVTSNANLNNRAAITIYNATAKGVIQENVIAYNETAVYLSNCQPVTITKNSFFCNINNPISINNSPVAIPFINVTSKTATQIAGTATPNATIELFYTDECQLCQGKTYIATVTANAAGKWSYTGALGGGVVGTATSTNGTTSPFSSPNVITSNAVVTPAVCGADGSITGFTYANATAIQWLDVDGTVVGNNIDLKNVPPGKYRLRVDNGTCSFVTAFYEVKDNSFFIEGSLPTKADPSCGLANGYVRNVIVNNPSGAPITIQWINDNTGQVVSGSVAFENMGPGTYSMHVKGGNDCEKIYGPVTLTDVPAPVIDESKVTFAPSKCYQPTGSVTGITATGTGTLKYSWKNEQNAEVGTAPNLSGQPGGIYTLMVTDDSNCAAVYSAQYEIKEVNDIAIDITTRAVTNATCENGDGFIKNVTVTPNISGLTYVWTNERNEVKGNAKDLSFVQAGTYTLRVSGGNLCSPIQSQPITVGSDFAVQLIRGANYTQKTDLCGKNTGEITGLETVGATTWLWMNTDNNTVAGHNLDLVGVPGGNYRLTYSNSTCSNYSDFEILSGPATVFTGFTATAVKSCFALNNGSISLNTDNSPAQPATYRWVDAQGNNKGFAKTVTGLQPGKYKIILTNEYNCDYIYPTEFTVGEYQQLVAKPGRVTPITCGVGTGSISESTFTGGSANYTYQWFDGGGNALPGQTQASISNLPVGKYRLHIEDGTCASGDLQFEIEDEAVVPTTPEAKNIKVFGNGNGTIEVTNPFETAIYRLYETSTSPDAIAEVRGGKFNVTVTESRSYYVTLAYGYCESARREVKVIKVTSSITNTITPNGDGINDYWDLSVISDYPAASVNIYTRYGQPVYRAVGYAKPFDGTSNGKQLPTGVYYYVIDLKNRNIISGYITIIR